MGKQSLGESCMVRPGIGKVEAQTHHTHATILLCRLANWGKAAAVRFAPSGERFAAVGEGGVVATWRLDAPTGQVLTDCGATTAALACLARHVCHTGVSVNLADLECTPSSFNAGCVQAGRRRRLRLRRVVAPGAEQAGLCSRLCGRQQQCAGGGRALRAEQRRWQRQQQPECVGHNGANGLKLRGKAGPPPGIADIGKGVCSTLSTMLKHLTGRSDLHCLQSAVTAVSMLPGGWLLAAGDAEGGLSCTDLRMIGGSSGERAQH